MHPDKAHNATKKTNQIGRYCNKFPEDVLNIADIESVDKILDLISGLFDKKDQFNFHVATVKGIDEEGRPYERICETKLKAVDTRRLVLAVNAFFKALEIKRKLCGIVDAEKRQEFLLKLEKFELFKSKYLIEENKDCGVVILPEIRGD